MLSLRHHGVLIVAAGLARRCQLRGWIRSARSLVWVASEGPFIILSLTASCLEVDAGAALLVGATIVQLHGQPARDA
eukprot:11217464-Lingulodinium_polyedra.AAC.1